MSAGPEPGPAVSVIMACRNGMPHLARQLAALAGQVVDGDWEVLVADNGSDDESVAEVGRWSGRLPVRVVAATGRRGAAHARNVGAAAAAAPVLLFVDADDVVGPGYVDAMARAVRADQFVAAVLDPLTLNLPGVVAARGLGPRSGLDGSGPWPAAGSGVMGIERALFVAVGGFDEDLDDAAEDTDLCWRVQRDTGVVLRLCESAVLRWRLRSTPRATFRQARSYGRSGPALYRRWSSAGLRRNPIRVVVRRWGAVLLVLPGRSSTERLRGLFLLGLAVGRLESSVAHRVVYL